MRKIVMLGSNPRTQRSRSSIQLPVGLECSSGSTPIFNYTTSELIYDLRNPPNTNNNEDNHQKLKDLLMSRWEGAKSSKVFKYDLNCMYRFIPGDFNVSMQLNVERGQLRRKPMRFRAVREPFNYLRWNFSKLNQNELLMYLRCKDRPLGSDPLDRHVIAINSAPLERGHSLVIPSINRCHPQLLTETAIQIATDLMLLTDDENFHMLFNSLLAHASVNHLHFHAIFWPYDSDLINRRCEQMGPDMYVINRPHWFIHTIVFQLTSDDQYNKFTSNLCKCADFLSGKSIAHNVFFSRAQPIRTTGEAWSEDTKRELPQLVTAYVIPRASVPGAKPAANFNPAALELAGCLTAYTYRFFETATEEMTLRIIDEEATLPDSQFNQICNELTDVLAGRVSQPVTFDTDDDGVLTSPELDELRDSFQTFELHSPRRFFANDKRSRPSSTGATTAFSFEDADIKKAETESQSPESPLSPTE